MSYEALNQKMLELKDEMLASIQESMRINSVRTEALPDAPYGEGPKMALEHALNLGKSMGFKVGCAENRIGWVEYGEGEEMVGILGHLDIVPVGEGWEHPALGAEIYDGVLWGRGCVDDKGPIIGALYGLKAIRDLNLPIDRRIRVLFGTDEESGSSCALHYVENGYEMPTIGFTPDAEFPAIFYEKGITFFRARKKVDMDNFKVSGLKGGSVVNIVPGKCELITEVPVKVAESDMVSVKEENGKYIVTAHGKECHGSAPAGGNNAIINLFEALKDAELGSEFASLCDLFLNKIGRETNGESLGICFKDDETGETTVNFGLIEFDGEYINIGLDVRYPKNGSKELVDPQLSSVFGEYGFEAYDILNMPSLYMPQDSELITKLKKVYNEQTGEAVEPISIGGGTYAKEFPNMVAFGPIFPGEESTIHKANERVTIDSLMKGIQIITVAMYELAQK